MICPACREQMRVVSVVGFDDSYRCESCGGVWMANWVVNSIFEDKEIKIAPLRRPKPQVGGTMVCPRDGLALGAVAEESAPAHLGVLSCQNCGWWWFGGDSLFDYAAAVRAKTDYLAKWKAGDIMRMALPALVLVVLVGGIAGGVKLVRQRQQAAIRAEYAISNFSVASEYGIVVLSFNSKKPVDAVEVRKVGDVIHSRYPAVMGEDGVYRVMIGQLPAGVYELSVGGEVLEFKVE